MTEDQRELGVEAAHVLGGLYAGTVALRLAQRYPGFVTSVVLVNPATEVEPAGWDEAMVEWKYVCVLSTFTRKLHLSSAYESRP